MSLSTYSNYSLLILDSDFGHLYKVEGYGAFYLILLI